MRRLLLALAFVGALGAPSHAQKVIVNGINVCPNGDSRVCTLFTGYTTATCGTASLSNVSTSETDLCTYSLPAGTLGTNGQALRVTATGTFAANANTKSAKLYFGSSSLTTGALSAAPNGLGWMMVWTVLRTAAATQAAPILFALGAGTVSPYTALISPTETLSGAVTIKVTGTSATGSNDATVTLLKVEWVP